MRFRIKAPGLKGCWWQVEIYSSLTAMRARLAKQGFGGNRDTLAACVTETAKIDYGMFGRRVNTKRRGKLGTLLFTRSKMTPGTVAHECSHAIMHQVKLVSDTINLRTKSFDLVDEHIAYGLEYLIDQILERKL